MDSYPCRFRNVSRRPIELHRGGEVVVIAPNETIDALHHDAELARLERAGALSRHAMSAATPASATAEPDRPAAPAKAAKPGARAASARSRKPPAEKGAPK